MEQVDSRDVMDANATTVRAFSALVVGHFRRTGPNSWSDYVFVPDPGEVITVSSGVRVQLEAQGVQVRVRRRGRVYRVAWQPEEGEAASWNSPDGLSRRRYFIEHHLELSASSPGLGAGAVIAKKLSE